MPNTARSLVQRLDRLKSCYGGGKTASKVALLRSLEPLELGQARDVLRLHESLCFLAAYPDDSRILKQVRRTLRSFHRREDVRALGENLVGSGVAGTDTFYRFYAPTARWLAKRWPEQLRIDWGEFDSKEHLEELMPLLVHYSETPGLDEQPYSVREWIEQLKGPEQTDAVFLIKRLAALKIDTFTWETLYNRLDLPLILSPGDRTPNRTTTWLRPETVWYQRGPLERGRPNVFTEVKQRPESVESLSAEQGRRMVDSARSLMVAYARELDAFSFSSARDVSVVHSGRGLAFAFLGVEPERRLMLEAVYGYVVLKNGVPIGYGTVSSLFRSSEIAFNIFHPFRGQEAGRIFVRLLAAVRHLFRSDTFTLYPYQLGQDNPEAIRSGAWWFYQKLGFRAREPEALKLMERELRRMKREQGYRSSPATLRNLAASNIYLHLRRTRDDVIGSLPLGRVGLAATNFFAGRRGAREESGKWVLEAARILGVRRIGTRSRGERLAWERWAPLVLILPGITQWSTTQKRALAEVIDAKGGRCERDFVLLFDQHRRLCNAVRRLAMKTPL